MKRLLLIAFFCATGVSPAHAARHSLSLTEAIEQAATHGPAARQLELEREAAGLARRAAARRTWPDIGLDLEAPRWSQDFAVEPLPGAVIDTVATPDGGTALVTREVFGKTTTTRRNASGALRYRQLLPWRGALSGDGRVFVRDEETTPFGVRSGRRDTEVQTGIGIEVPLLGPDDERASLRRATLDADAAQARIRQSAAQLVFDCTNRYLTLLRTGFALEVERAAATSATMAVELAEQKVRAGLVPEVDRMRIEVHRAERDARLAEAEAQYERDADEFKMFLGIAIEDSLDLNESLAGFTVDVDADSAVRTALERRTEIGIAAAEIELLEAERRARRPRWPRLDLNARYGGSASDASFEDAVQDLAANSLSFGVRMQWPLWDGGRGAVADAEDRTAIARERLALEATRDRIRLEVRDAVRRMHDASRRLNLLEASARVAAEQLRINAERYERGLLDTTGYLASQAEAEAARLGRMSALLDLYHARARLRLLILEAS
jgi:outer membrane protein TolC